ncbi:MULTISPECIES: aldehyde dehydrogenase family protein [unclassified Halomonas]|uniref:aldehyde dehydrogenase family protein n=1 Tax=unclassified Halomonas TaxID=2609666 RepID=UPI0007D9B5C5|nr:MULTISPECIES: aldehyde dehydrogenase family protein [unclassified Halomonas]MBT2785089.1 aldehyde dehydrogenase family protein [Halomonas sp. ISL-106]MBT2796783.1 aldehyde dehydrogenase family protein [Halomonas sp. ISL-104]OAL60011.1 aldehyde dehydrogenase [Halomonas sp. ALS9]
MTRDLTGDFQTQRQAADQMPYPTLTLRRERLARLARMTKHHQLEIIRAIQTDFGQRSDVEIRMAEISAVLHAIRHARLHLWRWMRPGSASMPWRLMPARARIAPQPLGVVGVMSPWNYPWSLALMPVVDAFAAGNVVMLKPSEHSPATSALLKRLVPQYFTHEEFKVIEGDIEVARRFSELPFDHLVFTGSTAVGRQVAQAAATNLTPVTLELGGKSPAIVAGDADFAKAAADIIFGKGMNGGQTCIAPDYVLVESRHISALVKALSEAIQQQRPSANAATHAINAAHQQRLDAMLQEAHDHGCRIIDHGSYAPALIIDPHQGLQVMREEIFGRCLPVIGVSDMAAAIRYVNARPHPLALYAFTHEKGLQQQLLQATRSGALVFNATLLHHAVPSLPFGGVGESGMGAYHGRHGFERFSHLRGVFYQAKRATSRLLYPPYRRWLIKLIGLG